MMMLPDSRTILREVLNRWTEISMERYAELPIHLKDHYPPDLPADVVETLEAGREFVLRGAQETEPYLDEFRRDHSHVTAEELEDLADKLTPGSTHDSGLLVNLVRANLWCADPLLVAAVMWRNWSGGKVGFQFMPNPQEVDLDEYQQDAWDLIFYLDEATDGDPRRLLTGDDLAFYESLPDRFAIYRGCVGLSPEQAGAGVCWTTKRGIADWFAGRGNTEPVVVTARIKKEQVRLAKSSEFEIVTVPLRSHPIKWRQSSLWGK